MFRPIPASFRFSSERVSVFTRSMRLCNDGEILSSVVWGSHNGKDLINTGTLLDENLMMAGLGRNM